LSDRLKSSEEEGSNKPDRCNPRYDGLCRSIKQLLLLKVLSSIFKLNKGAAWNDEKSGKNMLLTNRFIYRQANTTTKQFLDRIKNVTALRVRSEKYNFYLTNVDDLNFIKDLFNTINSGNLNFREYSNNKVFVIQITNDIYQWFKNNEYEVIKKQIVNWIAAYYLSHKDLRKLIMVTIYPPIFKEVKNVINNFYPRDFDEIYDDEENDYFEKISLNDYVKLKKSMVDQYKESSLKYINCLPPKFLKNSFELVTQSEIEYNPYKLKFDSLGVLHSPGIDAKTYYFTETDWIRIVEKNFDKLEKSYDFELKVGAINENEVLELIKSGEKDDLVRTNSERDAWDKFKYMFINSQNRIKRWITHKITPGFIYIIKQESTNKYKIGFTENNDIKKRIKSLQTGNPFLLIEVGKFRASSKKTEKTVHDILKNRRININNEWLELSKEEVENLLNEDWRVSNSIF